jgi:hypothetical protein
MRADRAQDQRVAVHFKYCRRICRRHYLPTTRHLAQRQITQSHSSVVAGLHDNRASLIRH